MLHLLAASDLSTDEVYNHIKTRMSRIEFLAFCRCLRSLCPPEVHIGLVLDDFSPHLSTKTDDRVGKWAEANNVELADTPFYGSDLNRTEPLFTSLRYFTLNGTDPHRQCRASQPDSPTPPLAKHTRRPPPTQNHHPSQPHQTSKSCLTRY